MYIIKTEKTIKLFADLVSKLILDGFNFVEKYKNLLSVYLSDPTTFIFFPRVRKYKWVTENTSEPQEAATGKKKRNKRVVNKVFVKIDDKPELFDGFRVPRPDIDIKLEERDEITAVQLNTFLAYLEKTAFFSENILYIKKNFYQHKVEHINMKDLKTNLDGGQVIVNLTPNTHTGSGKITVFETKKPIEIPNYHREDEESESMRITRSVVEKLLYKSVDQVSFNLDIPLLDSCPMVNVDCQHHFEYTYGMIHYSSHTHHFREKFKNNLQKFYNPRKYPFAKDFEH